MSPVSSEILFDSGVLVRSKRLVLRPLAQEHFPDYCQIVCNASTGEFDEEFPKSPQQARESFEESISQEPLSVDSWNEYGVFEEEGQLVGLVSHFDSVSPDCTRKSRVGYHFHPLFLGRGYATEAVGSLTSLLREQGTQMVECVVHPANIPSVSLLKRLGFSLGGFNPQDNELTYTLPFSN